jgi:hypothetical protein
MAVLDGNFALRCGLPLNTYISMYARTNRCYNEWGYKTNCVRSSKPHCSWNKKKWLTGKLHNKTVFASQLVSRYKHIQLARRKRPTCSLSAAPRLESGTDAVYIHRSDIRSLSASNERHHAFPCEIRTPDIILEASHDKGIYSDQSVTECEWLSNSVKQWGK